MIPACKDAQNEMTHYWKWEPLDGQERDYKHHCDPPSAGRWRIICGAGCGWTKEVTLTGSEVWQA